MFCPQCGTSVNDGAKFCHNCGNNLAVQQQESVEVDKTYIRDVVEVPAKNKGLKITLIATIAVLVIGIIGVVSYLVITNMTGGPFSNEDVRDCKECGDEFEGSGDLCEDCREKEEKISVCEDCGYEFEGEGRLCAECKAALETPKKQCNQCGDYMMSDGTILCEDCLEKIDYAENYEDGEISCFFCSTVLQEAEVAIIDTEGFVYCEDCDTENYCSDCHMPIAFNDDDTLCQYCADFACEECEEVLAEEEVAGQDEEGYYYCENCWQ